MGSIKDIPVNSDKAADKDPVLSISSGRILYNNRDPDITGIC
jgi:hypothetical protein